MPKAYPVDYSLRGSRTQALKAILEDRQRFTWRDLIYAIVRRFCPLIRD